MQTSCAEAVLTESYESREDSNPEVSQAADESAAQVFLDSVNPDPVEGTSQDIELLSDRGDQASIGLLESQQESPNECATCLVLTNQNRQLKNQVKSLQENLFAARKQRFSSRRTGN